MYKTHKSSSRIQSRTRQQNAIVENKRTKNENDGMRTKKVKVSALIMSHTPNRTHTHTHNSLDFILYESFGAAKSHTQGQSN